MCEGGESDLAEGGHHDRQVLGGKTAAPFSREGMSSRVETSIEKLLAILGFYGDR
jgi:hypothetical protein